MSPTIYFADAAEDSKLFSARCARSVAALTELGIGPGDVVALMLHNEPILLELMLSARAVGAHCCLINWHFKASEARHILSDSNAGVLIVHRDLIDQIRAGIPPSVQVFVVEPHAHTRDAFGISEPAPTQAVGRTWEQQRDAVPPRASPCPCLPGSIMAYTSGTTGLPKGIRRSPPTPEQVQLLAQAVGLVLGMEPGMRALVSAPMYHSAPAAYVLQAALRDAHLWIEPRFDAEATLRMVESQRITHVYLVPTLLTRLLRLPAEVRSKYDLSSLRFVACTGAPCPLGVKARMIDWWGPVIHESYAASELGWITHIDSEDAMRKPGSVGRATPGTTIKILSEDGKVQPPNAVGLIFARSTAIPDFTYANNDAARRQLEHEGLWTLRDLGYLDEDGYLYVVDRQSDMVISGGVNIYPAEIEATLATLEGVADSAVFGIPDEEFGESLVAAVHLTDGANLDEREVQAFLRARLASYKVPHSIIFRTDLPREDTGKIFKRRLKKMYLDGMQ